MRIVYVALISFVIGACIGGDDRDLPDLGAYLTHPGSSGTPSPALRIPSWLRQDRRLGGCTRLGLRIKPLESGRIVMQGVVGGE